MTIDTERAVEMTSAPERKPIVPLDVRALGPPKPLAETLETLADLDEGVLVQLNDRKPMHLYPKLDDRGYAYETIGVEGTTVTVIWEK